MQAALALAEQTGDVVHQSRCLTYLTVLYRKQGRLDQVRQYVSRSLAAATAGEMDEYIGMAKANLAWVAWREGDLAQAKADGRAALELWRRLPPAHSSCAFQWAVLWPLVGVALAHNQTLEAIECAQRMLEPTQQYLPAPLAAAVETAIRAWNEGHPQAARAELDRAMTLAQELDYL